MAGEAPCMILSSESPPGGSGAVSKLPSSAFLLTPSRWSCGPALFGSRTKTHSCASWKLFHVLSVTLALGEAVMCVLKSLPSGNNGPRTQQALEVTSRARYVIVPQKRLLPPWNYRTPSGRCPLELSAATQTWGRQDECGNWSSVWILVSPVPSHVGLWASFDFLVPQRPHL